MNTATIVGSIALALAGVLATGQALGSDRVTGQQKVEQREAMRRAALVQHQQKKDFLARNCTKRDLTPAMLQACRAAYRQL
jgi:phosphohistidine swiveling domain-containing protein